MRKAALTRGEILKEQFRVRFYAVSVGRSIAGRYPFRSNDSTSVFPNTLLAALLHLGKVVSIVTDRLPAFP